MASIRTHFSQNQYAVNISWNTELVSQEIAGMAGGPRDRNGLIIIGRSVREYWSQVASSMRGPDSVIISDIHDIEQLIRGVQTPQGRSAPGIALSKAFEIVRPVREKSLDRYIHWSRRTDLSQWTASEYAERIFGSDQIFSTTEAINEFVSMFKAALEKRTVLYSVNSADTSYFRILMPLMVRECDTTTWIVGGEDSHTQWLMLPRMEREYLTAADLVNAIANTLNVDQGLVEQVVNGEMPDGTSRTMYSPSSASFTGPEFSQQLNFWVGRVRRAVDDAIPDVPLPKRAPLEFALSAQGLRLLDSKEPSNLTADDNDLVLEELQAQIADLLDHHNISNSAPILASKMFRLRRHILNLQQSGITSSHVIALGMGVSATLSYLPYEDDDALPKTARGAITTCAGQIEVFINRFESWRSYVVDAAKDDIETNGQLHGNASIKVLTGIYDSGAFDNDAAKQVMTLISEAAGADVSPSELLGAIRTTQNSLAIMAGFMREQITLSNKQLASLDEGTRVALLALFYSVFSTNTDAIQSLATEIPTVFAWLTRFVGWIKSVGRL